MVSVLSLNLCKWLKKVLKFKVFKTIFGILSILILLTHMSNMHCWHTGDVGATVSAPFQFMNIYRAKKWEFVKYTLQQFML